MTRSRGDVHKDGGISERHGDFSPLWQHFSWGFRVKKASLLLIDDDRHLLDAMSSWLREIGYVVSCSSSVRNALETLEQRRFDLLLVDLRLEDGDGFQILEKTRQSHPDSTVILMSGYGTADTGVEAIRRGAFDFLTKPLLDEELSMALERALNQRQVVEENHKLRAQLDLRYGLDHIVGHDIRMQRIYEIIQSVADTKATVLITGESGTGKSMLARAIHRQSSRRERSFVEVACGALPESLLESELFGHIAGAFTGAVADKIGKFALANHGSIFLDEIGTASPAMQVKLLRVLQEFEFEPVGSTKTTKVDTRVILATNENLAESVTKGTFRQDLYYRVNVIHMELPPLRERAADVPLLASHFLEKACRELGRPVKELSREAMIAMQSYPWPGNVRELQNAMERAALLSKGQVIGPQDLPQASPSALRATMDAQAKAHLKESLEAPERAIIREVLELCNWNRNETAERLGINRTTLYKKMKRLGLERKNS